MSSRLQVRGHNEEGPCDGLLVSAPRGALPRRGQSSVDTVLLVGVVVTVLAGMYAYVQRAYQGYLYSNASSAGQQFDPRHYDDTQSLNTFHEVQDVDIITGTAGGHAVLRHGLGGAIPARSLNTNVRVQTDWDVGRRTHHETQ